MDRALASKKIPSELPAAPPRCYRNASVAAHRFGDLAQRYSAALHEVDALGGEAFAALEPLGGSGHRLLEKALSAGIESVPQPPLALRQLFASLENPPFPVDHERIERGARALMRHGFGYALATRQSLFWGYSNGAAIKPLAWTGEMRTADAAVSRLLVTGGWLHSVITPGGMRPRGEGWCASVRVRLLHSRVRASLRASGRWDDASWGAPLNAADSAFTLLEFTWMPLRMLRRLGFSFSGDDVESIYALWRYVGHLMGVPLDLNPEGEAAANRLLELRELTAGPADDQSRELVRALLDSNLRPNGTRIERLAGRAISSFDRALARRNLPADYPDELGISWSLARPLLPLLAGGVRVLEAARRLVPRLDGWLIARNEELIRRGEGMLRQQVARTTGAAHFRRS